MGPNTRWENSNEVMHEVAMRSVMESIRGLVKRVTSDPRHADDRWDSNVEIRWVPTTILGTSGAQVCVIPDACKTE